MAVDLTPEREGAQRLVDDLRAELHGIVAEQEANPPDDEHDVEGSSVGYERARVSALLAEAAAGVAAFDVAAQRLADGCYGCCERCGGSIGEERLAALPTTRRCLTCAAARRTRTVGGDRKRAEGQPGGSFASRDGLRRWALGEP